MCSIINDIEEEIYPRTFSSFFGEMEVSKPLHMWG